MGPKLANIEIGEISVVPKLSDIWCPNSRTKPPGALVPYSAGQVQASAASAIIVTLCPCGNASARTDTPRVVLSVD